MAVLCLLLPLQNDQPTFIEKRFGLVGECTIPLRVGAVGFVMPCMEKRNSAIKKLAQKNSRPKLGRLLTNHCFLLETLYGLKYRSRPSPVNAYLKRSERA